MAKDPLNKVLDCIRNDRYVTLPELEPFFSYMQAVIIQAIINKQNMISTSKGGSKSG